MDGVDLGVGTLFDFADLSRPAEDPSDRAHCVVTERGIVNRVDDEQETEIARLEFDARGRPVDGRSLFGSTRVATWPADFIHYEQSFRYDDEGRLVSFKEVRVGDGRDAPEDERQRSEPALWGWTYGETRDQGRVLHRDAVVPGGEDTPPGRTDWTGLGFRHSVEDLTGGYLYVQGDLGEAEPFEGFDGSAVGSAFDVVSGGNRGDRVEVVHEDDGLVWFSHRSAADGGGILRELSIAYDDRGRVVERSLGGRSGPSTIRRYAYDGAGRFPVGHEVERGGENLTEPLEVVDGRPRQATMSLEGIIVAWVWQDEIDTSSWTYLSSYDPVALGIRDIEESSDVYLRIVDSTGRHAGTLNLRLLEDGRWVAVRGRLVVRGEVSGRPSLITRYASWDFDDGRSVVWPLRDGEGPDVRTRTWDCP